MIIFRYIGREVFITLAGLTLLLVLIFLSNQFVHYLTRAAAGQMPGLIVLRLLMLEVPHLIALLMPLGLYVAILIAYGRLYAENEMTVLYACGFTPQRLFTMTLCFALMVSMIVGSLMLWLSPIISRDRDHLLTSGGLSALVETIIPGRFRGLDGGRTVFYVEALSRDRDNARDLFFAQFQNGENNQPGHWRIVTARQGQLITSDTEAAAFELREGREYQGIPGKRDYRISRFDEYKARLPVAKPRIRKYESALPTSELLPLNNPDKKRAAQLHWRLAIPIMTLVLSILAVPLSRVNPRQGKFAKIIPAIILYIIYANFLFVSRDWIADGDIPTWLGIWWLHGAFLLLALVLYVWPNLRRRWRQRRH